MDPSPTGWSADVGAADFERLVIEGSRQRPVVVDFWAPWCGPCRVLGPLLEGLIAERRGEITLAKVNIDDHPDLAARYGVQAIPQVVAFRDGRAVLEFTGVLPEPQLRDFLDRLLPSAADRLVGQARSLEDADPAQAEALYRQAQDQDRNHEPALLGLARVLLAGGREAEAAEALENVGAEGETGAEAERLKARIFLRQQARDLGDVAAARKRLAAEPASARRRYELGCVLAAVGQYPDALAELLAAAEADPKLAAAKVREVMVQVFYAVGERDPLADEYRARLARVLY